MVSLRCIYVVLFSLQLGVFAQNVLSASSVKDDAQSSLILLYDEINSTTKFVTIDIPNTWDANVNLTDEITTQELRSDYKNYRDLLDVIVAFTNNVTDGLDCVNGLLNITEATGLENSESISNIFIETLNNLLSLANVKIKRVTKQFKELDAEFTSNCVADNINCDGVSNYVIAEAEKLVQVLKRIKINFQAEVLVLDFKYFVFSKSSRAILVGILNSEIKNATICLASKIENNYIKGVSEVDPEPSNKVKDSISDSFDDLLFIANYSLQSSREGVIQYTSDISKQSNNVYRDTLANIRSSIFRANQTLNLLHNIAPEFNLTLNCAIPDLESAVKSSESRALEAYSLLGPVTINGWYKESLGVLNDTLYEVTSISLQVKECHEDCGYLADKIAKKSTEFPVTMKNLVNSTSVWVHQTSIYVLESGVRIIRDSLEELEVGVVNLKSCIQSALL